MFRLVKGRAHLLTATVRFLLLLAAVLVASLGITSAHAQTGGYSGSNTTAGAIGNTTQCSTPLKRAFVVSSSFSIADVNIGVYATHAWRGDLSFTLVSPAGTRVNIVNAPGGSNNSVDDFNVLLDDEATLGSVANYTSTAGSSAPPYTITARPQSALSAFDGEDAQGTWTLEICDLYSIIDNGNFVRADLYIAPASPQADLSLIRTVSNSTPTAGAAISYTLTVTNAVGSQLTASGVQVRDILPTGVTFTSASSANGSYSVSTGLWTLANSLAPGASATLTINGTVNASQGAEVVNWAEIWASGANDNDSTPGNNAAAEDDGASASFTVGGTRVAGIPPNLVCPAGTALLDWTGKSWSGSPSTWSLNTVGNVQMDVVTDAPFVAGSPAINTSLTGGLGAGSHNVYLNLNNYTRNDVATMTFTTPTAGGVSGLQFRIFDVDYVSGQYADRVEVIGYYNGAFVYPTLTNGTTNYVNGNVAIGDASAGDTSSSGTVVVTFLNPVDQVIIKYGNHTTAPSNPGNQWIGLHDITFCKPQAVMTTTKTSTVVSDPVNGTSAPKMIPGATVRYCISSSNGGVSDGTNILVTDALPSTVSYVPGSLKTGTSCTGTLTPEDDDNSGADESDPDGASISGNIVSGSTSRLPDGSGFVIVFDVTIK